MSVAWNIFLTNLSYRSFFVLTLQQRRAHFPLIDVLLSSCLDGSYLWVAHVVVSSIMAFVTGHNSVDHDVLDDILRDKQAVGGKRLSFTQLHISFVHWCVDYASTLACFQVSSTTTFAHNTQTCGAVQILNDNTWHEEIVWNMNALIAFI